MSEEYDYQYMNMWIDPYSPECVVIKNSASSQYILKKEEMDTSVEDQVCEEWRKIWID